MSDFVDLCNACHDRGRYGHYVPVGWGEYVNGGRQFHYVCRFGHSWSCSWGTDGCDPEWDRSRHDAERAAVTITQRVGSDAGALG